MVKAGFKEEVRFQMSRERESNLSWGETERSSASSQQKPCEKGPGGRGDLRSVLGDEHKLMRGCEFHAGFRRSVRSLPDTPGIFERLQG